jgi:L-threonylcarbamoyladenylate synthase
MEIINIQNRENIDVAIEKCIKSLKKDELIIYPTDTIYGIGCDVFCEIALEKIARVKNREKIQPYLILINSFDMLSDFAITNDLSSEIVKKYWPGPLTVLFKPRKLLSKYILGDQNKIAVRMPSNEFCLELIREYKRPITSTSGNLHSIPQGEFNMISDTFKEDVDVFIYDGEVKSSMPSTLVDLSEGDVRVIREGAIKI